MPRCIASVFLTVCVPLGVGLVDCSRGPLLEGAGDAEPPDADLREIAAPDAVAPPPHGLRFPAHHFDPARTGWSDAENVLVPSAVARGLRRAWVSPPLDGATLSYSDGTGMHVQTFPPLLFASPLYLDDVTLGAAPYAGARASIVLAATTNDFVYAIAAFDAPTADGAAVIPAGSIVWRTQVGTAGYLPALDGGAPLGVLSTPFVDTAASPPTLYVVAADASAGWQVFALDVTSGAVLPGWPLAIEPARVEAVDRNVTPGGVAPAMLPPSTSSQRSALLLSADRRTLFVAFGSYFDGGIGWMVAVDVGARRVTASFSGSTTAPNGPPNNRASGGMWAASGPALASDGRVFMTTGNSPPSAIAAPGVWGNSLLVWKGDLLLDATYSPFNYCVMDAGDTDLGGSSAAVFDVDPARSATPHLATFGGKQGVVYLVDRDHLGGSTTGRPPCDLNVAHDDPSADASLFAPTASTAYTPPQPGPLAVFTPYSDRSGDNVLDNAKMRTTPAVFRSSAGDFYVYATGGSRDPRQATSGGDLGPVVPPSIVRLRVKLAPGERAYLEPGFLTNPTTVLQLPGSPIVTSHDGGRDPVVWVLDRNAKRTAAIDPKPGYTPANAVLYAFDGASLATLWRSSADDLGPSGKYGHPVVAHGTVFVATDSVAAFTLAPAP